LPLDRTAKLYIGGKQKRPDSGYSIAVLAPGGSLLGEVAAGNRKDVREAVEAAHKAAAWRQASAHNRAQVLYYIAENLEARAPEFRARLRTMSGVSRAQAAREVRTSVARLFSAAAWADKYEGAVHQPPLRGIVLALHEPVGVIGIVCPDENPLLALVSLAAPALAMGNRVVVIPSERQPLAATDLYQVLDTSDLPGGALNIVTGGRDILAQVLAEHDDVDALWYFGPSEGGAAAERAAADNLKRVWSNHGRRYDWYSAAQAEGREILRHAVMVKNVWAPYGE
jgi:aldehyde dehydrogenase (NAD+)